jgi:hypothetical protein
MECNVSFGATKVYEHRYEHRYEMRSCSDKDHPPSLVLPSLVGQHTAREAVMCFFEHLYRSTYNPLQKPLDLEAPVGHVCPLPKKALAQTQQCLDALLKLRVRGNFEIRLENTFYPSTKNMGQFLEIFRDAYFELRRRGARIYLLFNEEEIIRYGSIPKLCFLQV